MEDATLLLLDTGRDEDILPILDRFNQQNEKILTFPDLDCNGRRQKLWKIMFTKLREPSLAPHRALFLQTIRILSRDQKGLNELMTNNRLELLVKLAGLGVDEMAVNVSMKQADLTVIVEAQKCLCNMLFHSTAARRICCNNGCVDGIVLRLKTYKDPVLPHDVKYFDMRMLFLITALCADTRPRLRSELHGMTYLTEVLDLIIRHDIDGAAAETADRTKRRHHRSGDSSVQLSLDDENVDLVCEVLKILFNLTVHIDRNNLDEEEDAHFARLVTIIREIMLTPTKSKEKREELQSHAINLLTNMPTEAYNELLTPALDERASENADTKDLEYDGMSMEVIALMLEFVDKRLDKPMKLLKESLWPVLSCLCECARSNRTIRKYCRLKVLPPLRDVYSRPEEGDTLRNKLCRLLTCPITNIKDLVADFLFILCKESVARMIKYTGYGNAAGLFASRGLMLGGRGRGRYSSESEDSETEEYRQVKDRINPVLGCYEEPRPDPMAGMTDEQKEYEAMQLVNMMDKLTRSGVVKPMRIGPDGRPHPVSHILELQEDIHITTNSSNEEQEPN